MKMSLSKRLEFQFDLKNPQSEGVPQRPPISELKIHRKLKALGF